MGYLWCPADWTKGEQTEAAVRLERGKERGVIRPEARDLHLLSALQSHTAGGFCAGHSSGAVLPLRPQR